MPAFYRFLQAQDAEAQISGGKEFNEALSSLVDKLDKAPTSAVGLWDPAATRLGWADVMAGPCARSPPTLSPAR